MAQGFAQQKQIPQTGLRRTGGIKGPGRMLLAAAAVVMTGCSSLPDISDRQREDAGLIQAVLAEDARLRQISSECMRLHPPVMPLAYESQTLWWQRNGRWVVAADQSLNKVVLDSVERTGSPVETTLGLSVSLRISEDARRERDRLLDESSPVGVCQTLLSEYREGGRDLMQNEALAGRLPRLEALAAEYYPPTGNAFEEMLQSPDRSQFIAERLARGAICEQAQLTPLLLQWPRELYNVSCGASRQTLIRCQWSECQVLP